MEGKLPKKLSFKFLPIPEELMVSQALSFGAKVLFGIIAKANEENIKWPIQYLSKRMNCSDRQTSRRIKELLENKLILVNIREGRTNEYRINLELIRMIQSDDETVTTQEKRHQGNDTISHQGNDSACHHIKEPFLKNNNKEDSLKLRNYQGGKELRPASDVLKEKLLKIKR